MLAGGFTLDLGIRSWRHDAAKESNLPSGGLPRPAGFEDRIGHQAPAAPPVILRSAYSRRGVHEGGLCKLVAHTATQMTDPPDDHRHLDLVAPTRPSGSAVEAVLERALDSSVQRVQAEECERFGRGKAAAGGG